MKKLVNEETDKDVNEFIESVNNKKRNDADLNNLQFYQVHIKDRIE